MIINKLRILSLLPAATEIVYVLGLEKYLVGVSHDCDFPTNVKNVPQITSSLISNAMSSLEIDMAVKKLGHRGNGVFHIDKKLLKKLNPNLILTQELCEVCALTPSVILSETKDLLRMQVESRTSLGIPRCARNDNKVTIISLEPESVEDILENILLVGQVTGYRQQAQKVVAKLRQRLNKIATIRQEVGPRNDGRGPKVLVIEWLDPIMVAGHWAPEMVERAGGKMLITKRGQKSRYLSDKQLNTLNPEILIISPCGFSIKRTLEERFLINDLRSYTSALQTKTGNKKIKTYLVDGNSYMTRPGPRIIDGIEILSEIIHPALFPGKHTKKDWDILNI